MYQKCAGNLLLICLKLDNSRPKLAPLAPLSVKTSNIQGVPIKNNPLEKNAVFQPW